MRKLRLFLFRSFRLLIVLGSCWGIGLVIREFFRIVPHLQAEVKASILAGLIAVFGSVITLTFSKLGERKASVWKELRDKKVPIYEELIELWFSILGAKRMGKEPLAQVEINKRMNVIIRNLIIWGADEVIKDYYNLRMNIINSKEEEDIVERLLLFEKTLFGIRRDLGHKNNGFAEGTILNLFMDDFNDHLKNR